MLFLAGEILSLTTCGWQFEGLGYGQIVGGERERPASCLASVDSCWLLWLGLLGLDLLPVNIVTGHLLKILCRRQHSPAPILAVKQPPFVCDFLISTARPAPMAKVAIEDLSGTTTPVTSNPYDGLISACHDDPVGNGRVLRRDHVSHSDT
jgi:hypothetical protein